METNVVTGSLKHVTHGNFCQGLLNFLQEALRKDVHVKEIYSVVVLFIMEFISWSLLLRGRFRFPFEFILDAFFIYFA